MNERPAIKRGLDVPEPFKLKEKMNSKDGEKEFEEHHSKWVIDGQKKDQETHKWVYGICRGGWDKYLYA